MVNVHGQATAGNAGFQDILEPFLQQPGLPFAEVLSADDVGEAFAARNAMFANEVGNRPGRIEPRVLKRRRHHCPLMIRPRAQPRKDLA